MHLDAPGLCALSLGNFQVKHTVLEAGLYLGEFKALGHSEAPHESAVEPFHAVVAGATGPLEIDSFESEQAAIASSASGMQRRMMDIGTLG